MVDYAINFVPFIPAGTASKLALMGSNAVSSDTVPQTNWRNSV